MITKRYVLFLGIVLFLCGCDKEYNSPVTFMGFPRKGGEWVQKVDICNQLGGVASLDTDYYSKTDCYTANIRCMIDHRDVLYCRVTDLKR